MIKNIIGRKEKGDPDKDIIICDKTKTKNKIIYNIGQIVANPRSIFLVSCIDVYRNYDTSSIAKI